jgi:hypothetical protein
MPLKKIILLYSFIGGLLSIGDYYLIDLKIFNYAGLLIPLLYILIVFLAMFTLKRSGLELNFNNLYKVTWVLFLGLLSLNSFSF